MPAKKYQLKTVKNEASVEAFLNSVTNPKRKADAFIILDLMSEITGVKPKMWGKTIVGFGSYHYKSIAGQEGDWMKLGFSPRVQSLTLYIMPGFDDYDQTGEMSSFLEKLGKYKTGKSCLYINKLEDVDREILKKLIQNSWNYMTKKYG